MPILIQVQLKVVCKDINGFVEKTLMNKQHNLDQILCEEVESGVRPRLNPVFMNGSNLAQQPTSENMVDYLI